MPRGVRNGPRSECSSATVSVPTGRRPADVGAVEETDDIDPLSSHGFTPTSGGVGGPGFTSAELLLIMNDADRLFPLSRKVSQGVIEYGKRTPKQRTDGGWHRAWGLAAVTRNAPIVGLHESAHECLRV